MGMWRILRLISSSAVSGNTEGQSDPYHGSFPEMAMQGKVTLFNFAREPPPLRDSLSVKGDSEDQCAGIS